MNISTNIRKDIVYTVVSAGVFCRTQNAKCTVSYVQFHQCLVAVICWTEYHNRDHVAFAPQTQANMSETNCKQTVPSAFCNISRRYCMGLKQSEDVAS